MAQITSIVHSGGISLQAYCKTFKNPIVGISIVTSKNWEELEVCGRTRCFLIDATSLEQPSKCMAATQKRRL
ncbi:hypothetical protein B9Q01_08490 [Candidatus Marsarchaeota G1 archaeon OSP_D]|uniref:Uncharacterized protein n=3 Tax=Candidatus Marsarchaeota group 1 TaxID=2203770 RepID=A0A2R6A879_9ARCH|nr:MAG: hypothetical protein B9Q01_08490 [Candidatus Marsarchaeota G1 archaeon OSP_D]PSN82547.1 MAG: hypothetical protein B9Q02_11560 [Candidatus Marsarchaeota G1 archaeon BE_D]PSN87756.1 MAG: hypothetical protein B9Q00_07830 [Candidatus Marsarchaeota G1 archaeon OSP_C]